MNLEEDLTISAELKNLLKSTLKQTQKINEKEQKEFNTKKEIELFLKEKKLIKTLLKNKYKKDTNHYFLLKEIYRNFSHKITEKEIHDILIKFGYFPKYYFQILFKLFLSLILSLLFIFSVTFFKIMINEHNPNAFFFFVGTILSALGIIYTNVHLYLSYRSKHL